MTAQASACPWTADTVKLSALHGDSSDFLRPPAALPARPQPLPIPPPPSPAPARKAAPRPVQLRRQPVRRARPRPRLRRRLAARPVPVRGAFPTGPPAEAKVSVAMAQTIATLQSQTGLQGRLLEEKDRQILELHALLREAMRRPTLALPAPAASGDTTSAPGSNERVQKSWWRRLLGR